MWKIAQKIDYDDDDGDEEQCFLTLHLLSTVIGTVMHIHTVARIDVEKDELRQRKSGQLNSRILSLFFSFLFLSLDFLFSSSLFHSRGIANVLIVFFSSSMLHADNSAFLLRHISQRLPLFCNQLKRRETILCNSIKTKMTYWQIDSIFIHNNRVVSENRM